MKNRLALLVILTAAALQPANAQGTRAYTRADTLRGSYDTPQRSWWDVTFYNLHVAVSPPDSSIKGYNGITYRVLRPLQTAACTYRIAFGPRAGQKVLTVQGAMPRQMEFKQTLCADINGNRVARSRALRGR